MGQKLFIQIQEQDYANWLVTDENGKAVSQSYFGRIEEAAPLAAGRQVIAFVPATEMTITSSQFPSRNRQKIMQGLPYVLEDQLADDIVDLHFAIGQKFPNNKIPVAIVSHEQMQEWLEKINACGIQPQAIVPDSLSVPALDGNWGVLLSHDQAMVNAGDNYAFSTDRVNLGVMISRAAQELDTTPESILVLDCEGNASNEEFGLDSNHLVVERCEQGALPTLARYYNAADTINLLQGSYSRREQLGKMWRPWRQSAVLAAVFLLLTVAGTLGDYFRLSAQVTELRRANDKVLLSTFPKVGRSVRPIQQMRQQVDKLKNSGDGGEGFLTLLHKLAPAIKAQGMSPEQMRYIKGRFDFVIVVSEFPQLDQLETVLNGMQFNVKRKKTPRRGDKIEATIEVTRK